MRVAFSLHPFFGLNYEPASPVARSGSPLSFGSLLGVPASGTMRTLSRTGRVAQAIPCRSLSAGTAQAVSAATVSEQAEYCRSGCNLLRLWKRALRVESDAGCIGLQRPEDVDGVAAEGDERDQVPPS